MATVYSAPAHLPAPDTFSDEFKDENGRWDFNAVQEAEVAWIESIQAEARSLNTGDLIGEVIRFPIADGYAEYVVWKQKPLQLIHLNTGDAYAIPTAHERGLNLTDVRAMVKRSKSLAELFGGSSSDLPACT